MPPSISYPIAYASLSSLASVALTSLALTLLIEIVVAVLLGLRSRLELMGVLSVNLLTNPLLVWAVFILPFEAVYVPGLPWQAPILVGFLLLELAVVLAEWRLLRWALKLPSRRTLGLSAAMNIASVLIGLFATWSANGL